MGLFLAYSLKSAVCLALFYLFYKVLLSRETFHRFNRIVLLSIIGLAASIPFLATIYLQAVDIYKPFHIEIITNEIQALLVDEQPERNLSPNNWLPVLLLIYFAGVCFCLLRSLCGIARLLWLIRKGKCILSDNKTKFYVHQDDRVAPFSWIKYIVISQADLDEAGEAILLHEQAHIRCRHTIDLVLAEICVIFQWYNPAVWLLYRELQTIHEFEADESVLNRGINAKQYQLLLIKKAVGLRLYSMANSFNHSNLKKRITMMLQKKSSSWARLKCVYVLPLAAVAVAAFARSEISQPFEEISSVKVSDFVTTTGFIETERVLSDIAQPAEVINNLTPVMAEDSAVYNIVDEMPEFPGGEKVFMDYIAKNIVYPVNMQKAGIQGRVVATYTVTSEGEICNVLVVKCLHPEADTEVVRLMNAMPHWKPGKLKGKAVNVRYTVPINFRLQN